jgi:hypothetical protein
MVYPSKDSTPYAKKKRMTLSRKPPLVQLRVPFILHEFNAVLSGEQRYHQN